MRWIGLDWIELNFARTTEASTLESKGNGSGTRWMDGEWSVGKVHEVSRAAGRGRWKGGVVVWCAVVCESERGRGEWVGSGSDG